MTVLGDKKRWRRWANLIAVCCLVAVVGWKYVHDARMTGPFLSHHAPGYYGLLTDALRSGQLNLKIPVDPRLLKLANPYAGPQGVARPHDMSFYHGKFYIYYGITPVLILFLPWRILTGTFLTEVAGTTLFCFGGFLLGTVWLLGLRKRLYPDAAFGWTLLAIALFGFGTPVFKLSANPTFYAVPIAAAFFCLMVALTLTDRAVRAAGQGAVVAWLACASLAYGLAVGARPNYVLGLAVLLLPCAWWWRRRPRDTRRPWIGWRIWAAAIAPAAAIGVMLALYNYLRFDNPFDFGMRYSMASADLRHAKLLGLGFIGKNLHLYLLKAADFVPYYPFVFTDRKAYGVLPHLPLVTLILGFPLTLLVRRLREDPRWLIGGGFLFGTAVLNLGVLCLFFGGEARYLSDFAAPSLLLAGALLPLLADSAWGVHVRLRRLTTAAVTLLAIWTLGNGICLGLENRVQTAFTRGLEYRANAVVGLIEKLRGVRYGPVKLTVKFPTNAVGRRQPLLTTGTMAGTGDIIYVRYTDEHHVQFGVFHLGIGGPESPPIALDYARDHTITLRLGSLYPPRQYPLFQQWSDAEVARLRRQFEVTIDGRVALRAAVDVYPTTPSDVTIGQNHLAPDVSAPRFTGTILTEQRLPVTKPPVPDPSAHGPVRLTVLFPRTPGGPALPLVCTGRPGAGDLFWVQILKDGRLRFGHDDWGGGELVSDPVKVDLSKPHELEVQMGSLDPSYRSAQGGGEKNRLAAWLDGKLIFTGYRPFNPSTAAEVVFGYNAIGASSAAGMFTGTILRVKRVPALQLPRAKPVWGPVRLSLRFPKDVVDCSEPLLTAGVSGKADVVYVHYVDADHVRIGLDHWGYGATEGAPIRIDRSRTYTLTIRLGSLLPPTGSPDWTGHTRPSDGDFRQEVKVKLDDKVALQTHRRLYSLQGMPVRLGKNDVGATSCLTVFTGEILREQRLPW